MGNRIKVLIIIGLILMSFAIVGAPKYFENINMMGYSIYNATWVNATYLYGSGQYLTGLPTGGVGDKWVDGGLYIYPNDTFAVNVWIKEGWLNVTSWLNVYGEVSVYGNLIVFGDINATGSLYGESLKTGKGNFTDDVFIDANLTSQGLMIDLK